MSIMTVNLLTRGEDMGSSHALPHPSDLSTLTPPHFRPGDSPVSRLNKKASVGKNA